MTESIAQMDQTRADAFSESMVDVLNHGALALMLSVGHRTGLFETMAGRRPATSQQIADAAGLHERYVREWLGAMTIGGVVLFDTETGTFSLPPEHAASLIDSGDNVALFTQWIAVMAGVEDDVVECFRNGGGVPYDRYPRFHAVMADDSGSTVLGALREAILPLVDGIVGRLEKGIDVLDVGCGSGRAIIELAKLFPESRFVGYDLSEATIAEAQTRAEGTGLRNVRFETRDLSDFDVTAEPATYDLVVTFDAIHDQKRPGRVLAGIRRSLRPDGVYLMQDIHASSHLEGNMDHPVGMLLYALSCMHCMTVSLAQGGDGVGAMWGRELASEYLKEAGFGSFDIHQLEHDFQNDYYVIRP